MLQKGRLETLRVMKRCAGDTNYNHATSIALCAARSAEESLGCGLSLHGDVCLLLFGGTRSIDTRTAAHDHALAAR